MKFINYLILFSLIKEWQYPSLMGVYTLTSQNKKNYGGTDKEPLLPQYTEIGEQNNVTECGKKCICTIGSILLYVPTCFLSSGINVFAPKYYGKHFAYVFALSSILFIFTGIGSSVLFSDNLFVHNFVLKYNLVFLFFGLYMEMLGEFFKTVVKHRIATIVFQCFILMAVAAFAVVSGIYITAVKISLLEKIIWSFTLSLPNLAFLTLLYMVYSRYKESHSTVQQMHKYFESKFLTIFSNLSQLLLIHAIYEITQNLDTFHYQLIAPIILTILIHVLNGGIKIYQLCNFN